MSNWTVTINKEEYEFDMFSEAVRMMKTAIKQHICINTDVFNTEANIFTPDVFFFNKQQTGDLYDEDIIAHKRMSLLMYAFMHRDADDSKKCANRALKGDIHYSGKDPYDDELTIDIVKTDDEIKLDIVHFDQFDEEYLRSNAFIFDDQDKDYYFKSHQIISTWAMEDKTSRKIDIDVSLKKTA